MKLKTKLILFFLLISSTGFAQIKINQNNKEKVTNAIKTPKDWYLKSLATDSVYGTGVNQAYKELLANKKPSKVIVAVIDNGIDTSHADLKSILWVNPNNGGYGWNFLGSNDGKYNIISNSKEGDREFIRLSKQYEGKNEAALTKKDLAYFNYVKQYSPYALREKGYNNLIKVLDIIPAIDKDLQQQYPNQPITQKELLTYGANLKDKLKAEAFGFLILPSSILKIDTPVTVVNKFYRARKIMAELNAEALKKAWVLAATNYRDGINDQNTQQYGNKLLSFKSDHGTHVAGIIAAQRDNNIGINGIADLVEIMSLRAIPEGDEYDIDVANAIRYAVDHGARVINMSFGKRFSPSQELVEQAIKYAEKKQVLIVKAAGNDAQNVDSLVFYPTAFYADGKKASNVITVGATDINGKIAGFSSFGKSSVDIFAPGVDIYATLSGGTYGFKNGTSMATPVVAGIAALLLEYYPKLNPNQVIDILKRSATPAPNNAIKLNDISVTGGIVNAYQALKLAEEIHQTL